MVAERETRPKEQARSWEEGLEIDLRTCLLAAGQVKQRLILSVKDLATLGEKTSSLKWSRALPENLVPSFSSDGMALIQAEAPYATER